MSMQHGAAISSPTLRASGLLACLDGLIAACGGNQGVRQRPSRESHAQLTEDQAESFRALAQEALMSEVRGIQESFAEKLKAFESNGLFRSAGKVVVGDEQSHDADRQVERLQRQVMKMEQKRKRRRLEATALRHALKEVRSTMVGVNTTQEEEGELAAEQLLNEIRSEREDWREEKRRLREQIERLEEELQGFTPSVDPEKENLRRSVKQLQNSIISRDQFSCWVCQQHLVRKNSKDTDSVDDEELKVEDSDDEDEVTEIKRQISLRRADLVRLMQRKFKRSASLSSSSEAESQRVSPRPLANPNAAPHSGLMRNALGRVPMPHNMPAQAAEADATAARQHVRWMEAEATETLEVVVDHPVRTSRNRVATPFVPLELPLRGSHQQMATPCPSATQDDDVSAEEASPVAINIQRRASRDRVATPFAPPAQAPDPEAAEQQCSVTFADVPDLRAATSCSWHTSVHSTDLVSVEDVDSSDVGIPMRSSRGRMCTPFVSAQDVVSAAVAGEVAGGRESGEVATPPLAHEQATFAATSSSVGGEQRPLVRFNDRVNISDLSPQRGMSEMRSIRSRVATPFTSAQLEANDGEQRASVQFSDEVSVASPTVEGGDVSLRSSRERIATPFATSLDDSSAAATATDRAAADAAGDEQGRSVRISDSFNVVEACSGSDAAMRSSRGRVATPFISMQDAEYTPATGGPEATGRLAQPLVQFSDEVSTASPCPGDMSPTGGEERPMRITRARCSTPFNFVEGTNSTADPRRESTEAPAVQFSEAVSVSEASTTDDSAAPLRRSRERLATPFVSLTDAEDALRARMSQPRVGEFQPSIRFSEDVSTTEMSPQLPPGGTPMRSSRGRVATPFVAEVLVMEEHNMACARGSGGHKRPPAVEYSADASAGYACAGPLRSNRGRHPTPFVSWEGAAEIAAGAKASSGVQFAEDGRVGAPWSSQQCTGRPSRSCRGRVATPFCSSQDAGDLEVAIGRRVQFLETVYAEEAAAVGPGVPTRSIRGRLATPFFTGPIEDTTTTAGRTVQFAESHAADVFVIPPVGEMRPVRRRRDSSSSSTGSDSRGRGNLRSPGPGAGRGRGRSPRTRRTLQSASSEPVTAVQFAANHEEVEAASLSAGKRARAVRERQPTGFVRHLEAVGDLSLPNGSFERNGLVRSGMDFQPRQRFQAAGDHRRVGVEGPRAGTNDNTVRFVESPMIFDGIRLGEDVRSIRGRTPTGFLHEATLEMVAPAPRPSAHFAEVAAVGEAASHAAPEELLRSLRTRTPTGFVARDVFAGGGSLEEGDQPSGVRFAEEASVHEAFITGELRPLRGRAPTGYAYPEELGCSSEAGTNMVRFAPGVTDTIHSRPSGRARVPTGAVHADDLPQDECRSGGSGSSTRTPSLSVREDRASISEDTDLEGDSLRAHLGIRFASAASVEEAPISPFLQELRPVRSRVPTGYLTEEDVAEMTLEEVSAVSFLEADISPLLISSEMKSSRSRTPTGWDGSILPLDDHRVRFTEASMRQGGGQANKYHRAESDASSVSSRSGSRRGGRSTEAPADTEEGISDSETQSSCSSRNPRSRMTTPYMNSTNLGFDTSVAPENRPPRCSSEGSKAGRRRFKPSYYGPWHSEGNDIPAASDRHMIKQVSMESNIERHISESVRKNMMRQAREDRMNLVKTGLACLPMSAQPGLERAESNLDSRLDKRRVAGVVKDTAMLRGTLKTLTFFEDFDDDSMVELIEAMELYEFEDGDKVVRQGDRDGSHFFVVAEGEFVITKDGKVVTVIGEGKSFGESVLLLFGERSATVCARGTARAYGMEGMAVREILRAQYEQKRMCVIQAVDEVLSSGACEMLSGLNAYQLQSLYDYVQMRSFDTGDVLLDEGVVEAKEVMVLFSGSVSVNSKGVTLEPMPRFGIAGDRQILFQEQPSTLVAEGPVQVLALSHALLESIFSSQLSHVLVRNQILAALTKHQVFSRLHEEQLEDVAGCCQIEDLAPGEDALLEDVRFIALLHGEVRSSLDGDDENPESHHCYGEEECEILAEVNLLRRERPWAIRLCAQEHSPSVKLAVWHSQDLDNILTFDNLDFALEHENKVRILKSAFIFQTLSKQQLQRLARALQTELVGVGERVFSQGDEGEHFYIIRKGLVSVEIDGRRIRTLGMGDYFGERAMLGNEQRTADISAEEETELWKMEKATFQEIMQGPCLEYLTARISLQDTKLTFQDLDFVRVVGRGGYGVVKMVRARHTGMRYALKCVRKREVVDRRQQEAIVSERSILAEVDHPFMVKFVRSFRTETRVYFLTELVSGGELLDALEQLGLLSHSQAMFYTGSILLALEFLHARRIAYLDLKSDNCLIDQQGYLKLIDFGMAKRINTARYTDMLGTPIFMAPEMILGKGYTTTADLWSLGICLYDFVLGEFPFADQSMDFGRIFDEVLRGELRFPERFLCEHRAEDTISMIRGLLTRDPSKRLGAGFEGYITLKEHAFFRGFNWDLLLGRELTPPFLPTRETYAEDKERPTLAVSENLPRLEEEEAAVDPRDEGWADPNPGWDIDF